MSLLLSLASRSRVAGALPALRVRSSFSSAASSTSDSEMPPLVTIPGAGSLQGSITHGAWTGKRIYQFLGIKYAESPSGARRFKAPVPALPWNNVRNVAAFGRQCPVYTNIHNYTDDQLADDIEDCLNLCVYSGDLSAKNPVMVYIHGGGFFDGGAHHHPPEYLLEKDIVLVVPQYRVGPLGFLSMRSDRIPGNAGVLDVLLSLEWVQRNIVHFGGDPDRVTAHAQSAGAAIISALTYSPLTPAHLFSRVILQSGGSMASWTCDNNPERNAKDIAKRAGYNEHDRLVSQTDVELFLEQLNVRTLLKAFTEHMQTGTFNGVNTIGGHRMTIGGPSNVLPINPYEAMRAGGGRRDLPMLIGVTKNDGTFTMANIYDILMHTTGTADTSFNSFKLIDKYNQIIGVDDVSGALTGFMTKLLFTKAQMEDGIYNDMVDGLIDLSGVTIIKAPVMRVAQANAHFNPTETYLYTFDYKGEFSRFGYGEDTTHYPFSGGVHHSDDNIYLFPWPKTMATLNAADTAISKRLIDLWVSFATDGVPTAAGVPSWPPLTKVSGPYLHIDQTCTIGTDFLDEFDVAVREGRAAKQKKLDTIETHCGEILKSPVSNDLLG